LALFDPAWKDSTDAQTYAERRDQHRLYQFLMALRDDFELVRGQLLHRSSLLFLLLFERRPYCLLCALSTLCILI